MAKEIAVETSLTSLKLAREELSLDHAHKLLAIAKTSVPGEIKAKFLRDQEISTVEADVVVEATGQVALRAMVHVKLTFKGDMVRSSYQTRDKINNRLQDAAQKCAAEAVFKELVACRSKRTDP